MTYTCNFHISSSDLKYAMCLCSTYPILRIIKITAETVVLWHYKPVKVAIFSIMLLPHLNTLHIHKVQRILRKTRSTESSFNREHTKKTYLIDTHSNSNNSFFLNTALRCALQLAHRKREKAFNSNRPACSDMLHLQRELHCFYFLQVSDCLLSCPDYKIQRFQQLKHGGPNTKGPISTPDLPFTTLYATFKRQIADTEGNKAPEELLQQHSLLYLQSCKLFYEYHPTKRFKKTSIHCLCWRRSKLHCMAGSDHCRAVVHPSLCTDLHPHPGFRICKGRSVLRSRLGYFLLLPGGVVPLSALSSRFLTTPSNAVQSHSRVYTNQSQSTYKGLQAPAECPLGQGPVTPSQGQRLELSTSTLSRNVSRRIKSLYHEVSASTAFLLLYH